MNLIRRILALGFRVDIRVLAFAVLLTIISAVVPMSLPLLFGIVIDHILHSNNLSDLPKLLGLMALVISTSALVALGSNKLGIRLGYELGQKVSLNMYQRLLKMSILTYPTINQGVLTSRLTNDLRMVEPLFVEVPITAIRGWASLVAVALALLFVNPLFLTLFIVIPLSLVFVRYAESQINETISESFQYSAQIAAQIENTTSADAVSLIRQAQATKSEILAYDSATKGASAIATKLEFWRANVRTAYDTSFELVSVLVLGFGAYLSISGLATVGGIVSAVLYIGLLRRPLSELIGLRYPILRGRIGLTRIEEVLNSSNTGLNNIVIEDTKTKNVQSSPSSNRDVPGGHSLKFENVRFMYPSAQTIAVEGLSNLGAANSSVGFANTVGLTSLSDTPGSAEKNIPNGWTLDGISFSLQRGEIVAISGVSGSGKSTIVGLTCGLLRPTEGRVLLNGLDTADLVEEEIWAQVSLVSQDIYLRNGTLRENLLYGLADTKDEELIDACRNAGLSDLLSKLPAGLETQVGSRGKRFSGGERQRISIARAILKNAALLVLDEATSHLDSSIESDILASIEALRGSKAILIVAHRLSAMSHSDRVVMIENGKVVERGTHLELLAKNGKYSAMHKTLSDGSISDS